MTFSKAVQQIHIFFTLLRYWMNSKCQKNTEPHLTWNLLRVAEGGTQKVVRVSLGPWDKTLFTSEVQSENAVVDRKTSIPWALLTMVDER